MSITSAQADRGNPAAPTLGTLPACQETSMKFRVITTGSIFASKISKQKT
jgi:hypothetical protein